MWQRIQTIFIVIAIAACVACLCLPIATISPEALPLPEGNDTVMNLYTLKADGSKEFTICGIVCFTLLLFACSFGAISIFTFKKRKLQALLCMVSAMFTLAWIAVYGISIFAGIVDFGGNAKPAYAACFPVVAFILFLLARRAILKDEALVRAADRIR